ncbi:MAG TPA: type II toxin-antitoxin system VapC family toxin [Acidimicrobiia bacterium]|jgi:predicted nucleic acid-binding protein
MRAIADTSLFIAFEAGRTLGAEPPDEVVVSVVTIGELRLGVLMADGIEARQRRLSTLQLAAAVEPIPIDGAVATAWAELVATLRTIGRSMKLNDSWIAATALAHELPVATQDADFDHVPGLNVIRL